MQIFGWKLKLVQQSSSGAMLEKMYVRTMYVVLVAQWARLGICQKGASAQIMRNSYVFMNFSLSKKS